MTQRKLDTNERWLRDVLGVVDVAAVAKGLHAFGNVTTGLKSGNSTTTIKSASKGGVEEGGSRLKQVDSFLRDRAQNANRLFGEKLPAEGAGKASWKLGKPMSELTHTISPDAKTHLIAENKPISGKKGVLGTHNSEEFYNKLKSTGKDINNMIDPKNIVYDKDFPGLQTIEYKIPKGDGKEGVLR